MAGPLTTTRLNGGSFHVVYGPSHWGPTDGDSNPSWEKSESMDDCVTPGWNHKRNNGLIVNNDMTKTLLQVYRRPVHAYRKFEYQDYLGGPNYDEWQGVYDWEEFCTLHQLNYLPFLSVPSSPSDSEVAAAKELALTNAFASVSEAVYLSGQDAAEARQTIRMLVDYFKDALRLLRAVRDLRIDTLGSQLSHLNRRFGSARGLRHATSKSLRSASNQWLRYRYGLRPLMYSIRQAVQALQEIGKPERYTSRGFEKLSGVATTDFGTAQLNNPGWGFLVDVFGTFERTYFVSAGVLFENTTLNGTSLQRAFGLRIDDILPTAWELVPYSFVVDWFCNIGQVVRAWSPLSEARVLTSWVKVTQSDRRELVFSNWRQNPAYGESGKTRLGLTVSSSGGGELHEDLYVTRTARPEKPIIPHVTLRVDLVKLLDLLALIRQLI